MAETVKRRSTRSKAVLACPVSETSSGRVLRNHREGSVEADEIIGDDGPKQSPRKRKSKSTATREESALAESPKKTKPSRKASNAQATDVDEQASANETPFISTRDDYIEISVNRRADKPEEIGSLASDSVSKSNPSKITRKNTSTRLACQRQISVYQLYIIGMVASSIIRSRWLDRPVTKAVLYSVVPGHLSRIFAPESDGVMLNSLRMLSNWWKNTFGLRQRPSTKNHDAESRMSIGGAEGRRLYQRLVFTKQAYEDEFVQMFAGICRVLGMRTRYVVSIQPIPRKPSVAKNPNPKSTVSETSRKRAVSDSFQYYPTHWVEILHSGHWIPVDCVRAMVNDRLELCPPPASHYSHLFIVAVETSSTGRVVTDVTRRYTAQYNSVTVKQRAADENWWRGVLAGFNQGTFLSEEDHKEDVQLYQYTEAEAMPSTMAAFKNHPKYILESHVKKYEIFHPEDDVLGTFKDERVYKRSAVHKVRSRESWLNQFARVIKEGESPSKIVNLPRRPGQTEQDEPPKQPLYGFWQTEPYEPPIPENGRVPRNKFDNVDLFQPSMLPVGCVHIPFDGAWRVAKQLQVDYANACIGFHFHGRRAAPKLQGIVVLKENQLPILDAYDQVMNAQMEKEAVKYEQAILNRWEKLVYATLVAARLKETYMTDELGNSGCETPSAGPITSALAAAKDNFVDRQIEDHDFFDNI